MQSIADYSVVALVRKVGPQQFLDLARLSDRNQGHKKFQTYLNSIALARQLLVAARFQLLPVLSFGSRLARLRLRAASEHRFHLPLAQ